jgi:hypothetical protein
LTQYENESSVKFLYNGLEHATRESTTVAFPLNEWMNERESSDVSGRIPRRERPVSSIPSDAVAKFDISAKAGYDRGSTSQ